jgi:hypothetical protein
MKALVFTLCCAVPLSAHASGFVLKERKSLIESGVVSMPGSEYAPLPIERQMRALSIDAVDGIGGLDAHHQQSRLNSRGQAKHNPSMW